MFHSKPIPNSGAFKQQSFLSQRVVWGLADPVWPQLGRFSSALSLCLYSSLGHVLLIMVAVVQEMEAACITFSNIPLAKTRAMDESGCGEIYPYQR